MISENFTQAEIGELNRYRKSIYTFLSRIYREEIDQALFDSLKRKEWPTPFDEPEIDQGYNIIKNFLKKPPKNAIELLAVEYANIFLGTGKNPAYPFESVYMTKQRLEMQMPRDGVIKIYRGEGFKKAADFNEPEDHIATELEFMAHLAQKTLDTLRSKNHEETKTSLEKQLNFLNHHLIPWTEPFCRDAEQAAELDFYKGIAKLTQGFVSFDYSFLKELVI
jgi:anaerobic sulfite reductase subunit A